MEDLSDKKNKRWISLMNFGAKMGCHQMPERSFFFKGYQFPVCARCTGVFVGEIISIIAIVLTFRIHIVYAIALVVPLAIDGGVQYINVWKSNNIRRVITGILAGVGLTYVYFYALIYVFDFFKKII